MAVLLLQLVAPMQSWGYASRWDIRDTGREPTKSGVVGLLAAACGIPRNGDIGHLAALRMSVRVDCEGKVERDFQTVGGGRVEGREYGVPKAAGGVFGTVTSERFYIADAAFLVALEGEARLLREVEKALAAPYWPLSLGRRSYPPAAPILTRDAMHKDAQVEELFLRTPPLKTTGKGSQPKRLRASFELKPGQSPHPESIRRSIPDQPISFAPPRHTLRDIEIRFIEIGEGENGRV